MITIFISRNQKFPIFWFLIITIFLTGTISSCANKEESYPVDISNIDLPKVEIKRYGKALLNIEVEELSQKLPQLQEEFPLFLQGDLDDTLNIIQLAEFIKTDYIQQAKEECQLQYTDLGFLEKELAIVFQRNKALFINFNYPEVYTYISGFDITQRTAYFEDAATISLDMYLGEDYKDYQKFGFPSYKQNFFKKEYIVRDLTEELNLYQIPQGTNFLEMAIAEGKKLFLLDALLPQTQDSIKIKYRLKQLDWAEKNERELWSFIIENELLYSKDAKVLQKFFLDSPFTSYFGQESPPRLGQWLGWQIVKRYFQAYPKEEMVDFLKEEDAQRILKMSEYRPS
jgi:hypothetical protein